MRTRWLLFAIILLLVAGACVPGTQPNQPIQETHIPEPAPVTQTLPPARRPDSRIHFGKLGIEDGLSQSSVMTIAQDRKGFLWFGTEDGLNRYDGEKFEVFRPVEGDESSLSDVWVSSIAVDREGGLWVGTRQGGLNRYDEQRGGFKRYQHQAEDANSLSHNHVNVVFSDSLGQLWVGTEAGLDFYQPQSQNFKHFLPVQVGSLSVHAIVEDGKGGLWLGTTNGLWRFIPSRGEFQSVPILDEAPFVSQILVNLDGTLWLGTIGNGLIRFFLETGTFQQYMPEDGLSNESVNSLLRDKSGKIWVGSTSGLNLFDPVQGTFISYYGDSTLSHALSADYIHVLFQDSGGVVWIGTYGGGVNYYDYYENRFVHFYNDPKDSSSLAQNSVFGFAPSAAGSIWVATNGSGLDRFNPDNGSFTHFRYSPDNPASLRNNFVWSVLEDRAGKVWVGTQAGLDRLDPILRKFTHFPVGDTPGALPGSVVYSLYQDGEGTVWVGTNAGLARFDAYSQTFSHYGGGGGETALNDANVIDILETRNGMLWVGTFSGGLSRLDPETGLFRHYVRDPQKRNTISNNSILALHESRDGKLWIGTAGGGLNRYDPTLDIFTHYTDVDGLPNNVIYGILEDEAGKLWLSTNFGIAQFDPLTGKSRNYTAADGLQSNEFNMGAFAQDSSGKMYFGGVKGFNIFSPVEMVDNPAVPQLNLVSMTNDGISIDEQFTPETLRAITLRPPDDSFEFEFAAMNFSQSRRSQYAYMLDGYDQDWFYAGNTRTGRYVNLPGGDYVLRMKAANADGRWNETGISLPITIIPPFWKTEWFYGFCFLAILLGGVGVYRMRVRNIEVQKRELERLVNERTKQIEQLFEQTKELAILEERNRLARDLHDSAKQKAFAALAQLGAASSLARSNVEKAFRHMQEAEVLVSEVIQEITFLIQEIHPAALEEKGLGVILREYAFEWGNRTDIAVELNVSGEHRLGLEIEQALFRAIQEALANVARHSGATVVKLTLWLQSDRVEVDICDNGRGFEQPQSSNGMGLRSIRERVARFGGSLTIESAVGCGTRLCIRIPIKETV